MDCLKEAILLRVTEATPGFDTWKVFYVKNTLTNISGVNNCLQNYFSEKKNSIVANSHSGVSTIQRDEPLHFDYNSEKNLKDNFWKYFSFTDENSCWFQWWEKLSSFWCATFMPKRNFPAFWHFGCWETRISNTNYGQILLTVYEKPYSHLDTTIYFLHRI